MLLENVPLNKTVVLVDTNVIIEAVRTHCWNALTGGALIETVEECRDEALRGDPRQHGYVPVSSMQLGQLARVHPVSAIAQATFGLTYPLASAMDAGERDLFAHVLERMNRGDSAWILTSPDKASIRAAVALGWGDRLRSLGEIAARLGAKPKPDLAAHHEFLWLSKYRTEFRLNP